MPAPAGAREALTVSADTYEVFAIRYATRDAQRSSHFIGGDPHDGPMPMDYFVWLVRNANRTIVVDTGFTADMAKKRTRKRDAATSAPRTRRSSRSSRGSSARRRRCLRRGSS